MIDRTLEPHIRESVSQWPVTLITGARQVGKSTLCWKIKDALGFEYVSLDDPLERALAINDPSMFIKTHKHPLIIDEIQYAPELFDEIEHIINEKKLKTGNNYGMFILTGSQSYALMQKITESMAGRVNIIEMSPLSMSEIHNYEEVPFSVDIERIYDRTSKFTLSPNELYESIIKGMYPEIHANSLKNSSRFYKNYVNTYLERDVSLILNIKDKVKFTEFLTIMASLTGEELVYETVAKAVGVSAVTVKSWISILVAGHVIKLIQPYYDTSIIKRIVKHPKVYFVDTGLACYLLGINNVESLNKGIFKGRLVETYIVNEIMKSYNNNCSEGRFFYYRDSNGREIDFLIVHDGEIIRIECKSGMMFDQKDVRSFSQLKTSSYVLAKSCIICNTPKIYPISEDVYVLPITSI